MPSYLVGYKGATYFVKGQYHSARPSKDHDQPPEPERFEISDVLLGHVVMALNNHDLGELEWLILRDNYGRYDD